MKTILIIFSANSEWRAAKAFYDAPELEHTPYGECFYRQDDAHHLIYLQGGWGKIAAAASAQYGIQRWQPDLVLNLGTCGGFAGRVQRGALLLVERTLVYDIFEQMGDSAQALAAYSVTLDLSWLNAPLPQPVTRGLLISADRDIRSEDIDWLTNQFGAIAADWESGAIAWVCAHNAARCLILRGVSDLVSVAGGEAYGAIDLFHQSAQEIISDLLAHLEGWLACINL